MISWLPWWFGVVYGFFSRAYTAVAESPRTNKKIARNIVVTCSPVLSTDSPQRGMTNAADKLEIKFPVEAMVLRWALVSSACFRPLLIFT